uniref:Putative holin n=1 Tax=viral metagenome TaxID=1070528 RepID=A0A6H1ZZC2_9ZZZZ
MSFDPLTAVMDLGGKIIDKIWQDPTQRDQAKLELLKMQQSGELDAVKVQMSAILAEAQSSDPWTSRARPSFLYVMYIMILAAIPMGILSAFNPDLAVKIADGLKAWLAAIPEALWAVFGIGYTGYTVARSAWDKKVGK